MTSTTSSAPKLAKQFDARSAGFVRTVVVVAASAMAASFALSFQAQIAVGELLQLPVFMRPLIPLGVDLFIVVSVLALLVARAREGVVQKLDENGRRRKDLPRWWRTASGQQTGLIVLWTLLSAGLNAFHGLQISSGMDLPTTVALVVISVIFPVGVLSATETLTKILVAENTDSAELAAARTRLANAGAPVAARPAAGGVPRSLKEQELDVQIRDAHTFSLDGEQPTLKALAERFNVSAARVKRALAG